MRRSVEASLEPSRCEYGREHVGRRTLSVGTCDVDGREMKLGLAKMCAKCQSVAKVFFKRSWADALEHRELGKKVFKCLPVGFDGD